MNKVFSSIKNSHLVKVFLVVLLAVLFLQYKMAFILEPSSFDMILELTTFKLAPVLKPAIFVNNYRPQLGQFTFFLTGGASGLFGILGGYIIRYILFTINIMVFYQAFKQMNENEKITVKEALIFIVTTSLTFFSMIKYFYVVDFLTSLIFSFIALIGILQNRSKVFVFIIVFISIYFKFSIFLFLIPLLIISTRSYKNLLKYALPIFLALGLGVCLFFIKSVDNVLAQRGVFSILQQNGFMNFMLVNILAPWEFFHSFDQSTATYAVTWTPYVIAKLVLIIILGFTIFTKNRSVAVIDFGCVVISLVGIIAIQPRAPWFHDIAFYAGIIGLLIMVIAWKYRQSLFTKNNVAIIALLFVGDFYYWNSAIESVGFKSTKFELQESLKSEIATNKVTNLYLYCMNNLGEFEWHLKGQKDLVIHYILDKEDIIQSRQKSDHSKSIWLFPKKCLHEIPPFSLGEAPSNLATLKKEMDLNSMEQYKFYTNY